MEKEYEFENENNCESGYDELIEGIKPFDLMYLRRFDDADSHDCVGKFNKIVKNKMYCKEIENADIYNDFYYSEKIPKFVKMIAKKAIRFAENNQMNSEIVCLDTALYVTIKFEKCLLVSDKWDELIELYSLSDCAYYTTEKEKPHEIIIRLAYNLDN